MQAPVRPRRSVLYMPGSNPRALEKGRQLPADALILDLEDAVAPDAKPQGRDAIRAALATKTAYGRRRRLPPGPRARLRRQDADPPQADRPGQRRLRAVA